MNMEFYRKLPIPMQIKEEFPLSDEFIQKKKILAAAELLKKGESVLSAGTSVGFADNSYFINLFKRFYKVTPLQYKRENHLHFIEYL